MGLLVFFGILAFVVDHGVLMVARGQAQNSADAAALAGAVSRAFDEPTDAAPASDGMTVQSINAMVDRHIIGGDAGTVTGRTWSWACPAVSPWPGRCVRVNVFRNGEEGSPLLPMFFGQAVGLQSQGTRATATAIAAHANGSKCLKPWIIPDMWEEHTAPTDEFNPPGDIYMPPNESGPGTGYTTAHIGTVLTLKPGNPQQAISPSDFSRWKRLRLRGIHRRVSNYEGHRRHVLGTPW